ncbi:VTC domain-containing protein [Microbacterium sediminicola]|uniref:VTC domain-containing protein n=1 Tax=Microbacterium sediminicola TaxID=415210 RepID=A0ABN2IEL3_9MICO
MSTLSFERFAPVGLEALVAEAGLMTRVDRKYLVPMADAARVVGALGDDIRVLEIEGARQFAYESIYFDTPDLLSFHMAAHGRRRRFKLRTRSYLDTDAAFLEIKTRGARGVTVKERSPYELAVRDVLTDDARAEVAGALDSVGVHAHRADELEATLSTRYDRATLVAADASARVTIDTDLQWIRPEGQIHPLRDFAIIETKSGSSPGVVDRLLWRSGHRPVALSKYATGMAALHEGLPHNKWARLLHGPFGEEFAVAA